MSKHTVTSSPKTPNRSNPVAAKAADKKKSAASGKSSTKTAATDKPNRSPTATPRRKDSQERRALIAEAAYLRAESLSFNSDETQDWLLAEIEVDARLNKARKHAPA